MKLLMNDPLFEYDIRGLLMAYYPWRDFVTDPETEDPEGLTVEYAPEKTACRLVFETGEQVFEETVTLAEERTEAKNQVKRALYNILSKATGDKRLPWGALTGIRPVKLPMADILEGKTREETVGHLKKDYLVSDEKAELAYEIAERELKLISRVDTERGYSLYVGVPFCPTTCLYCSFTSYPIKKYETKVDDYLEALEKELLWVSEHFKGRRPDTVYFGGGTPTTLDPEQLKRLCGFIQDHFDLSGLLEWTVEGGRPDSITKEKLEALKRFPVTRLSVNPQTMHQRTLDLIGRRHTVEDVLRAYELARETGFNNINMDLIVGLPGEDGKDVEETMDRIVSLNPENVTIHSLAIKRAARLNLEKSIYADMRMENSDEVMDMCRDKLKAIGLHPYYLYRQKNMAGNQENVGYAREGKEGIYNILIMEEVESILACGAGATSKRVRTENSLITRAENVKNVDLYMQNIDEMILRKEKLFSGD